MIHLPGREYNPGQSLQLGTTALVVEGGNEEKELGPDTAVY